MKCKLGIWLVFSLIPVLVYAQDEFDTRDYAWMQTIIDSIETSELCLSCDITPSINAYYTRGYYTPPRTLRFRLYYACDNQSSVTKYFEKDGSIAGICIVDSTSRDCMDDITALTYTFGLDIQTIWSCDYGYTCGSAPKSLLFPAYEVDIVSNFCDPSIRTLSTSSEFASHEWLGPDGFESHDKSVHIEVSGEYHSIVENELGCYDTLAIEVDLSEPLNLVIDGPDIICGTEPICLELTGYHSYLWSTGDTSSSICINSPGQYFVLITNEEGCTEQVESMIRDGRDYDVMISEPNGPIYAGQTVSFDFELIGLAKEDIISVHWIIDDQRHMQDGPAVYTINDQTNIAVELETISGCIYSDDMWIDPLPVNREVYFANAFNPFSKKGNDRFSPQFIQSTIELKEFSIFDRWGNEVYFSAENDSLHEGYGWDGRYNNQLLPPGTYLYMAELVYADGISDMKTGTVLLIY